jgi:hypothetical protein
VFKIELYELKTEGKTNKIISSFREVVWNGNLKHLKISESARILPIQYNKIHSLKLIH